MSASDKEQKINDANIIMTESVSATKSGHKGDSVKSLSKKEDSKGSQESTKMDETSIIERLRVVIEKELSRSNLSNNHFLVSQMNAQMYVPVTAVLQLESIKKITSDATMIVKAVSDSKVCSVDASKKMVKPNINLSRNTIILREIPSEATEEEIIAVFKGLGVVKDVRPDVGANWFVTMEDEETAKDALLKLQLSGATIKGYPIRGRLKSANLLRSISRPKSSVSGNPRSPDNDVASSSSGSGYRSAPGVPYANSYYIPPYMPQYNPFSAYGPMGPPRGYNGQQRNPRGPAYANGQTEGRASNRTGPSDGRKKFREGRDRRGKVNGKDGKRSGHGGKGAAFEGRNGSNKNQQQRAGHKSSSSKDKRTSKKNVSKRQEKSAKPSKAVVTPPEMNTMNFPALAGNSAPKKASISVWKDGDKLAKQAKEQILNVVNKLRDDASRSTSAKSNSAKSSGATKNVSASTTGGDKVEKDGPARTPNVAQEQAKSASPVKFVGKIGGYAAALKKQTAKPAPRTGAPKVVVSAPKKRSPAKTRVVGKTPSPKAAPEKPKSRPRRGWEKTEELKQQKEAAMAARRARMEEEEEMRKKAKEDAAALNVAASPDTKSSTEASREIRSELVTKKAADEKQRVATDSSDAAPVWGARKSFADVLKSKKAASADAKKNESVSSTDTSSIQNSWQQRTDGEGEVEGSNRSSWRMRS